MAHIPGADGGKGSMPRQQQNRKAYSDNWDRIFGKKNDKEDIYQDKVDKAEIFEIDRD